MVSLKDQQKNGCLIGLRTIMREIADLVWSVAPWRQRMTKSSA
jgi:hypothetical protein